MKTIKVTGTNDLALVDDEDYPVLSRLAWRAEKLSGQPITRIWREKEYVLRMHRLLKPYKINLKLICKDGNPLDNQKDNLVYKNASQLMQVASKAKGCISEYKGVTYRGDRKKGNRWRARIFKDRKHYFLGYHPTQLEAALAYNEAARELYGKDAFMNEIKQPTPTANQAEGESK